MPNWVQGTNTQISGAYGFNVTMTLTGVAAGNCLVVSVGFRRDFTTGHVLLTCSDTQGNIYSAPITSPTQPYATDNLSFQLFTFVALNAIGGDVTVTVSGVANIIGAYAGSVDEYSGVATVSAFRAATFNSTVYGSAVDTIDSGNVDALDGDMLYAATYADLTPLTLTPTSGFTLRESIRGTDIHDTAMDVWDKAVSGDGTYSNTTGLSDVPNTIHTNLLVLSPTTVATSPLIQVNSSSTTAIVVSSLNCAYKRDNTAGGLLVVLALVYERTDATVTDSQGNTWNMVYDSPTGGPNDIIMGYALNCKGGPNVVTLSTSGGGTDDALMMIVVEYIPVVGFTSNNSSGIQTGASTADTGTVSATDDQSLLISGAYVFGQSPPPISQDQTFRYQFSDSGFFNTQQNNLVLADTIVGPGDYNNVFDISPLTGQMDSAILGFKLPDGPPPPVVPRQSVCGVLQNYEVTRDIDADWRDSSTFYITHDDPFPFTLRALVLRMSYNQD